MAPISSEPSVRPIVRPSIPWCLSVHSSGPVRPSVRGPRSCGTSRSLARLLRPYPSASLRNGNAFCFSSTLSSPEGERARDSFNNPAARSEIYYFRTTLLDKSIWLIPLSLSLSLPPTLWPRPPLSFLVHPTPETFFPFAFTPFLLHPDRVPACPRTSVQGDLINREAGWKWSGRFRRFSSYLLTGDGIL